MNILFINLLNKKTKIMGIKLNVSKEEFKKQLEKATPQELKELNLKIRAFKLAVEKSNTKKSK